MNDDTKERWKKVLDDEVFAGGHVNWDGNMSAYAGRVPSLAQADLDSFRSSQAEFDDEPLWDLPEFKVVGEGHVVSFKPRNTDDLKRCRDDVSRFFATVNAFCVATMKYLDTLEGTKDEDGGEDDVETSDSTG